ncbi:MAG: phosphatase [Bacteroidetes bacterium]|nr:MAG: phosphatase [Bacteroidota bacterium]
MKRIAIIDLGTNTFNLLIVDLSPTSLPDIIFKTKMPVKLGRGGINKGVIAEDAFQRGLDALAIYKKKIEEYDVESTYPIATSAIRSANNGVDFVNEVSKTFQMNINVITGNREAELIYLGVRRALSLGEGLSLIMDIGGGSTEFIIANQDQTIWKKSFNLGVARIMDKFQLSDPLSELHIADLREYFTDELEEMFSKAEEYKIDLLIGSSGSFESLAEIIQYANNDRQNYVGLTEYQFDLVQLKNTHSNLLKSSKAERENLKGLVDFRVETIVIASIFIDLIVEKLEIGNLRLSTYSLREGVMSELAKK